MKRKITKRDVFFFILGLFTLFLIEMILDWDNQVKAFKEGFEAGYHHTEQKLEE